MQQTIKKFQNHLRKRGSSEHTIYDYCRSIQKIFTDLGKNWLEATSSEIEDLVFSRTCSIATKQKYLAQMRSFLNFCYAKGFHPLSWVSIFLPKVPKKEANYLTEEQIHKLLAHPMDRMIKVAIRLMLSTGMRVAEAHSVTKEQLKNAEKVWELYQISILGKGRKLRSVFVPEWVRADCLAYAGANKEKIFEVPIWSLVIWVSKISKELWFHFSSHTLRHTFLTMLVKSKADLYRVQKLAGHSNIAITSRYLHTTDYDLSETASLVKNLAFS